MPRPRSAGQRPSSRFTLPQFLISDMCELALTIFLITLPWYYVFYNLPPQFSVQLQPSGGGLNVSAPAATAFHGDLHASNRRATERCFRHGEGVVTYAGFTIASGNVPGFCVPGKGRLEVPFLLAGKDGVGLPEHLRERMAAENKVGALELKVQVRLFQHGGRPSRMWCKARVGGAQPPEATMCTVFALQNMFDTDA